MQILLDHLASIFITGAILLIIVFIQLRGSLGAAESTINHMVYSEALNINKILERDLENMLTPAQIDSAGSFVGGSGVFACSLVTNNGRTQSLTFPTLADPDASINTAGNPNTSAAIEVTYLLEATGDSALVPVGNASVLTPLFTLNRYVGANITASSLPYITYFDVGFGYQGDLAFVPDDTVVNENRECGHNITGPFLTKVRFDFKLVAEGIEFIARDQRSTSQLNISRFGSTVSLSNWE